MNKSKLSNIILLTLIPFFSACGENSVQKFELKVTDESGKPLKGVTGKAWFNLSPESGAGMDSYLVSGSTNAEGKVELEGETLRYRTAVGAEAKGYYPASKGDFWMKEKNGNRWEPWPVRIDLVMKKILNPVPMFAYGGGDGIGLITPDSEDESFGYDLLKRDWVAPFGSGKVVDFVFTEFEDFNPDPQRPMTGKMKLTFPNEGDGIVAMPVGSDGGSELLSPQEAPEGFYAKEHPFVSMPSKLLGIASGNLDQLVWIFRIRTVTDEKGKIISSLYGKIYGYPQVLSNKGRPAIRINYYVNGKPNDRSLEWDMKTNLFLELKQENWPARP